MKVVDASAVLEVLLRSAVGIEIEEYLLGEPRSLLSAPELLDLEVLQVLRRYHLAGELSGTRCLEALEDLEALPLQRHRHAVLVPGIWALRRNLTAYDAAYLALAELVEGELVTCDVALSRAPDLPVDVRVFGR